MKHPYLAFFARCLQSIGCQLFPLALVIFGLCLLGLCLRGRIPWWSIVPLLLLFVVLYYIAHEVAKNIGSFLAYVLHGKIGVYASVEPDGLTLTGESLPAPQQIAWSDIALIRRVYARFFTEYGIRFAQERAYQIVRASGEWLYVDYVTEAALRAQAAERNIPTEGFATRLLAWDFEMEERG